VLFRSSSADGSRSTAITRISRDGAGARLQGMCATGSRRTPSTSHRVASSPPGSSPPEPPAVQALCAAASPERSAHGGCDARATTQTPTPLSVRTVKTRPDEHRGGEILTGGAPPGHVTARGGAPARPGPVGREPLRDGLRERVRSTMQGPRPLLDKALRVLPAEILRPRARP